MLVGGIMNSIADSGADYMGIVFSKGAGQVGELVGFFAWFLFVPAALAFTIAFSIGPTKQRIVRAIHATVRAAVFCFITRCATTIIASVKMATGGAAAVAAGSKLEASIPIFLADAIAIGVVLGLTIFMADQSSRAGSVRLIYGKNEYKDWSLDHTVNRIGSSEVEIPIRGFQGVEPVHACIFRQGSQFLLDCQHAPGFVNGYPVAQVMLNHGDMIQLGEAQLVFYSSGKVRSTGQEWNRGPMMHPSQIPQQPTPQQPFPQQPFAQQPMMQTPLSQPIQPQVPMGAPVQQPYVAGQPVAAPIPISTVTQVAPPCLIRYVLIDLAGKEFPLQVGINTIGREVGNTVCLSQNSTVSRSHAQLVIDNINAILIDVGSANGTGVNGSPVTAPVAISDGDTVAFGSASLTFRVLN
jgi:pSer/pThr/pTyr-binding forkhead associated (FHA) protein